MPESKRKFSYSIDHLKLSECLVPIGLTTPQLLASVSIPQTSQHSPSRSQTVMALTVNNYQCAPSKTIILFTFQQLNNKLLFDRNKLVCFIVILDRRTIVHIFQSKMFHQAPSLLNCWLVCPFNRYLGFPIVSFKQSRL